MYVSHLLPSPHTTLQTKLYRVMASNILVKKNLFLAVLSRNYIIVYFYIIKFQSFCLTSLPYYDIFKINNFPPLIRKAAKYKKKICNSNVPRWAIHGRHKFILLKYLISVLAPVFADLSARLCAHEPPECASKHWRLGGQLSWV